MSARPPLPDLERPMREANGQTTDAIDTSDIPDVRPGARFGTLREAIERARARGLSAAEVERLKEESRDW